MPRKLTLRASLAAGTAARIMEESRRRRRSIIGMCGDMFFCLGCQVVVPCFRQSSILPRVGKLDGSCVGAGFSRLLGPTIGTLGLICDLHTPKRFYNMLRLFELTSPMSIGSWILAAFGNFSALTAAAEFLGMRPAARATQLPLVVTGAGLKTYTALLLSANNTPLWAAAPCATAVKFASSSVAAAASALSLGQGRSGVARDLDKVALAALVMELAATLSVDE
jgi:protein NrfD